MITEHEEKERRAIAWYLTGVDYPEDNAPGWYFDIIAARYLGVAPWDISDEQDAKCWRRRALIAMDAEREAREYQKELEEQDHMLSLRMG